MKLNTCLYKLRKSNDPKVLFLIEELIQFLDDFFYYTDLFNKTNYNDVFYYLYIEEKQYSYVDIAYFIHKEHTIQIHRLFTKIESFILLIIDIEEKYVLLREYMKQKN